ncbi:unnamed protein product [Thelazia callipaeda]|uniref:Dentin sialophosphoprotein-like n=1 Tax=Thelazia callipaeda TaxID=103827 RepID=A0A0N5CLM6_THECL|nr:unnamed protein product [Thelazia callipaeda]
MKSTHSVIHTTTFATITTTRNAVNITPISTDILCNNNTEFVCICQHIAGNLRQQYIQCSQLIELDELPIIEMNIRRVNLSARLHTDETYESYFKRRVATVVSNYCEQQADECLTTTLRLKKENVVLLRTQASELQSTIIGFVVTKSQRLSLLNTETILDSIKVKYILSAQLAALSRILGGVRIERIETVLMTKYQENYNENGEDSQGDNLRLLIILFIVVAFLVITYIVAAIRVCRDYCVKRKANKNDNKLRNASEVPNYGTCISTNKTDAEMDHSEPEKIALTTRIPQENLQSDKDVENMVVLDPHRMRRMFECDPSQLPAEERLSSSETSNNLSTMTASKSSSKDVESGNQGLELENKKNYTTEIVKENNCINNNNEGFTKSEVISGAFQKYSEIPEKMQSSAENSLNSTTYIIQPLDTDLERQDDEWSTNVWNRPRAENLLNVAWDQPESSSWNSEKIISNRHFDERCWNQMTENEGSFMFIKPAESNPKISSTNKQCDGTEIISKVYPTEEESKDKTTKITHGGVYLKRTSLIDKINALEESEISNVLEKKALHSKVIQKSRTAHKFDHWSSESDEFDDESDAYHKLSDAEKSDDDEMRSQRKEKIQDLIENPKISKKEENEYVINLNVQSCNYRDLFKKGSNDGPYYERLRESPLTPNSFSLTPTSDNYTSEQCNDSLSEDDLK